MSDLAGTSRTNGGARPVPVVGADLGRVTPPTEIMRRRQERDAKKREQDRQEEIERRRRSAERRTAVAANAPPAVGVAGGDIPPQEASEFRRPDRIRRPPDDPAMMQDDEDPRYYQRRGGGGQESGSAYSQPSNQIPDPTLVARKRTDKGSGIPQPNIGSGQRTRNNITSNPQPIPVQQPTTRPSGSGAAQGSSQTQTSGAAGMGRAQGTASSEGNPRGQSGQQANSNPPRNGTTSSFPHAFERWEQLSAHWEGLTSYWIKRLDSQSEEISHQPINQQLARQVTDLSAAGANLFHAVVELQRLRASSERKFQRWFFETRSEQARTQERIEQLEAELQTEWDGRSREPQNDARAEVDRAQIEQALQYRRLAEDQLKEMKRELHLSRDEARRGWEEIGRMEQAERDRTYSLKQGQPTLVGGVQVVPMLQGQPSRQTSSSRDGAPGPSSQVNDPSGRNAGYSNYDAARSDTDTDPYGDAPRDDRIPPVPQVPSSAQAYRTPIAGRTVATQGSPGYLQSTAPASNVEAPQDEYGQPYTAPQPFYQHGGSATHLHVEGLPRTTEVDERSFAPEADDAISVEDFMLDDDGQIRTDERGNPIIDRRRRYPEESLGYARPSYAASGAIPAPLRQVVGGGYGGSSNGQTVYSGPDYSGAGYGWEGIPRHQHPTRLSDVLEEEDERSRTSPSRTSERSRGVR